MALTGHGCIEDNLRNTVPSLLRSHSAHKGYIFYATTPMALTVGG